MKSFFIILATWLMISNCCRASPLAEAELLKAAKELSNKITNVFGTLESVRNNVKNAPETLNQTINSYDYDVPKNEQVVQLREELKKHKSDVKVSSCEQLLDFNLNAVKKVFDLVFWLGVNSELEEIFSRLDTIESSLEYITYELLDKKLSNNIKLCQEAEDKCKITKEYPDKVKELEKSLDDMKSLPNSLIKTIINDDFRKQVSDKIKEEVYPEVSKCIEKLKEA